MRAGAGLDETETHKRDRIHQKDPAVFHVRDVEHLSIRGRPDVLWHRGAPMVAMPPAEDLRHLLERIRNTGPEAQMGGYGPRRQIDLHELARELARRDGIAPVHRELQMVHAIARD